jgi:WD40 repeat protein
MTKTIRKTAPKPALLPLNNPAQQVQLAEKLFIRLHKDEVWDVCFSNDGTRLASSGRDETTIIYHVDNFTVLHILKGHSGGIGAAVWSPDDSRIVTCSQDSTARIWDTDVSTISSCTEQNLTVLLARRENVCRHCKASMARSRAAHGCLMGHHSSRPVLMDL